MGIFRGVQLEPDPIQPTRPNQNRPIRDWSVSSGGRWRVANPRNRVRRVGWRVLSSKTRLNRPDRSLNEIRRNKNFPASFLSEYLKFLWDLGRIWGDVTESSEISARSGGNLTGSSKISPDPVRSSPDLAHFGRIFHRGRFRLNRPCFRRKSDYSDPTFSPVGGGSERSPPESGGSVSGWAQTRPEPTHGHP